MDMYAFQELEVADNPAVIFRGIVGSHAYGTANAASDTDVRGVFVVPSCEYVRLSPPPKQVSDERNDRTYYSLLRFCELMSEANPTTMEMLCKIKWRNVQPQPDETRRMLEKLFRRYVKSEV